MMRKPFQWPSMTRLPLKARSELIAARPLPGTSRAEKPTGVMLSLYVNEATAGPTGSAAAVVSIAVLDSW